MRIFRFTTIQNSHTLDDYENNCGRIQPTKVMKTGNVIILKMRNNNIDLIKSVAMIMVIFIHASSVYFYLGESWNAANFYDSIPRGAVPLFFMCSGALLLGKIETLGLYFKKRVIRIIPAMVAWTIIYQYFNNRGFTLNELLPLLYTPAEIHLWYLYAALGISLFVPLFRRCVLNITFSEKILFVSLWVLSSSIAPLLMQLYGFSIVGNYHLYAFSGYAGCLFVGYFMMQLPRNKFFTSISPIIFLLSTITIFFITKESSEVKGFADMSFYDTLSPLSVLSFVSLFYFINNININSKIQLISSFISKLSLGIYCSHMIFLALLVPYFKN